LERRYVDRRPRIEGAGVIFVVVIIIMGGILIFSISRVHVGFVAVVVDPVFGSINSVGDGLNARYFFKSPWASVYKVYVATDSVNMWTESEDDSDFPSVPSLTRDGLKVDVDITVRWRVSASNVINLFRRFPALDWKDRAIIPIIRETIRNLIVDFTAIQTIEQRGAISSRMVDALNNAFAEESSLEGALILDAVNIRRITLPDNFVNAIESKLAAEQLAIAAEFNKTRILVIANATAQSGIIEAKGIAKSKIMLANATREAIEVIAGQQGLNATKLTNLFLYLETLRDIANSGKGSLIIAPNETGQFIIPLPP
jgi:regulator of protease activity HflC (stomatin/prohibitin superfamily)